MHLYIREIVQAELKQHCVPSDFLETEVVVILGARPLFDFSLGRWRSTKFNDNLCPQIELLKDKRDYQRTPPLSHLRVVAAQYLIERRPRIVVIISGGTRFPRLRPSSAHVMKEELGFVPNTIILNEASHSTADHFPQLMTLCPTDLKHVAIVTNAYHVPRAKAMLKQTNGVICGFDYQRDIKRFRDIFSLNRLCIHVIAAEAVIKCFNPDFGPEIDCAYGNDPFVQAFIELEGQGIEQLQLGTYQFT